MPLWNLNDIPWNQFDAAKVQPELVALVAAACMVEHNSEDYARYLCEVFPGDEAFAATAKTWAEEEVQHGMALRRWVEMADPAFDFDHSFTMFTTGFKLPENVHGSVRGSRTGELLSRCVVETGTSTYYTAIKEYTDEPVLKAICAKVAADEFRHYTLFYNYLKHYLPQEKISLLERLKVAIGRVTESDDDELAFAFYTASQRKHPTATNETYDRQTFANRYLAATLMLYRRHHIDRMLSMVFKAVGLKPNGRLNRLLNSVVWNIMRMRMRKLKDFAPSKVLPSMPSFTQHMAA